MRAQAAAPLTFDLPESLLEKIGAVRAGHGMKTNSEVVRLALECFALAAYNPKRDPHIQISVRISGDQRRSLKAAARKKDTSIGEILRAAIEALPKTPRQHQKKKAASRTR